MNDRPSCYPGPSPALISSDVRARVPWLDVLVSPVPEGVFQSPTDERHVLCVHLGEPVPVSYRDGRVERQGVRMHGQFCVVPAGSSTRWILSGPAQSLLLRLAPSLIKEAADVAGFGTHGADIAPSIHIRDPQIERIGWMMQAEERDGYPSGRLFSDSLGSALAARLVSLQSRRSEALTRPTGALPAWCVRRVLEYIEAHLDQDLTLAQLAAVAGFSVSHFKPMFKRAVGMPAHRFVLERRIERAHVHLLEGGMSMTDIALAVGFAHTSHMARCMRRVWGVSPSQIALQSRPSKQVHAPLSISS
jgi:AraC family transcriptional regulator